jgi:hypothetical protein
VRLAIEIVGTIIWLPMELLVIATLLRGQYRRFPLLLAFVIAEFLAVAAEIPAYLAVQRGVKDATEQRLWLYLLNEVVLQALIYAIVISLIYQATAQLKSRRMVAVGVVVGAIVFAAASFAIHRAGGDSKAWGWLTPWTRDLNFCSAILDLGLWTLLISSRKKDSRLLLIAGGLGIRFTGEAIGDSIRQLASRHRWRGLSITGGAVGMLVDIVSLFIWWQALRNKAPTSVPAAATPSKTVDPPKKKEPRNKRDSLLT